jgi:uncharacterized protein
MTRVSHWVGLACLLLTSLAAAPAATAASFDCAKAGTPTEKAICKDPAVSKLDEQVAAAFKTALTFWPAGNWKTYILTEQRNWLKDRNAICKADTACLKTDYERRLVYLTDPDLKWTGRYVAGQCPRDGIFLDATPNHHEVGVSIEIYICPRPGGNMLLQASGEVDAGGTLDFVDIGCPRTLTFTQDTVTLSGPVSERCQPVTRQRVFRRDPARSPFLLE